MVSRCVCTVFVTVRNDRHCHGLDGSVVDTRWPKSLELQTGTENDTRTEPVSFIMPFWVLLLLSFV